MQINIWFTYKVRLLLFSLIYIVWSIFNRKNSVYAENQCHICLILLKEIHSCYVRALAKPKKAKAKKSGMCNDWFVNILREKMFTEICNEKSCLVLALINSCS